jgi:hypothetical protein
MLLSFSEVKCVSFADIKVSQVQYHKEMSKKCTINLPNVPFNVFLGAKIHQNARKKKKKKKLIIYCYILFFPEKLTKLHDFFFVQFFKADLDYAFSFIEVF